MNLILIALIALGLYAYRNKVAAAVASGLPLGAGAPGAAPAAGYALIGPNSDPSRWYQGIKPGTVTVGGSPAGADWQPSHATQTGLAIAGSAIGGTLGVASMAGSTIFAAGTTAGLALGAATLGIGLAATVVGMIYAHHAAALAAEGKALNSADPRALQSMALVLQAVLAGEITSVGTAQEHLDQIVNDWYGEVKGVQRGTWHYTGQDLSADYEKVWIKRTQPPQGAPGYSDYHAPDPCNGACVVGHFFIERGRFVVLDAVEKALAGQHGVLTLGPIPKHETQQGFPEILEYY